ncbi:peptidoglycan-binding protein [Diaphorobacter sp. HDW4A]|nr:peptidoglycan-binding domain-containing protein [Diaphorobacter sp. HDW4A]QIL82557.1 peptidoglycan-binding protein [Diaphorobacter sp. HDW4A]
MRKTHMTLVAAACAAVVLTGCETTDMKMGSSESKTVATGAAGGSSTANASSQLERCQAPLGTVSLVENQDAGWYTILRNEYRLPPTANLLRLLVQQSNCFIVVERSAAGMRAMDRERQIMGSGEMRGGSNFGKGQMVASDYAMSPEIIFSNSDAGGIGGALGGLIGGGRGAAVAAIGGSLKTREASAMLTLVDNRSGVQVSASEGSASKSDFAGFGGIFGGSAAGGLGGYQNTAQGKVITAAFMDAYNQMVVALRSYRAQSVQGQGLGGGGRLGVDGAAAPSQTRAGASMSTREAQARLQEMGYNVVPDGSMGAKTMNAIRAYQKDQGLSQSGRLDKATVDALSR